MSTLRETIAAARTAHHRCSSGFGQLHDRCRCGAKWTLEHGDEAVERAVLEWLRNQLAEAGHRRSFAVASGGEHKGRYYCPGCSVSVDDFTAYADWPCPVLSGLGVAGESETPPAEHGAEFCSRSFARVTNDMIEPVTEGWGKCRSCGEVVNLRTGFLPDHRRAAETPSAEGGDE